MKNIVFAISMLFVLQAQSQEITVSPINEEFLEFIENYRTTKSNSAEGFATGLNPSPFSFHFSKDSTNERYHAFDIPSSYDLRIFENGAYLTSVKNQGQSGTCWTFAVYGSAESYILKQSAVYYDFSEQNMATCHGFDWDPDFGGNFSMSIAYFGRHAGPVNETDDPYTEPTYNSTCTKSFIPPLFIENAQYLPGCTNSVYDIDQVKQAIMNYGALAINMYYKTEYYNPQDYTYYYNQNELTNHAIILIGWDDNKVVTGGSDSPSAPGAWIVRNSWGESWGEDGFFYISYEDTRALKSIVYFPSNNNYYSNSLVYLYDETGMTGTYGYGADTGYGLVKYTPENDENLERIGTYATSDNTILNIEVYDNFDGKVLSDLLGSKYNITCRHAGYYTFEFDDVIPLKYNDDYYIKVYYHTPNYIFPIPREFRIVSYNGNTPIEESGKCWTSLNGNSWTSIGYGTNHEWDLCIKAYTALINTPTSITNSGTAKTNGNFYPNPSNGILSFNIRIRQIQIYALTGSCVMTLYNPENIVDLGNLREGYYIIKYTTDNQQVYKYRITILHQ